MRANVGIDDDIIDHAARNLFTAGIVEHLQGKSICTCDGLSATTTNWVMDRILNKL